MFQGERVKEIRKELGLTLEKFGDKIGLKKNSLSQLENGVNKISEQTMKSICREFNVNYFWLRDGEGDMFLELPETVLDELIADYKLDEIDKRIIKMYLTFPEDVRQIIKDNLKEIFVKED